MSPIFTLQNLNWNKYEAVLILGGVIIITIIAVFSLDLVQSRIHRDRFSNLALRVRRWLFICILLFSLLMILAYVLTDRLDTVIGVYFGVLGIVVGVFFALKPKFESKTVCIISKSGNNFNISLVSAFRRQLESESGINVREVSIHLATPYDEDWRAQERAISSNAALTADAIFLIPAVTTDDLTERVVQLQKKGIFFILCDHKMTNQRFFESNIFPPSIVMPNCVSGGKLIGSAIAAVSKNPHDLIIVLRGPSFSGPGTIKSEACIRELVRAAKTANLHLLELRTWHPVESADLFMNFVSKELLTKVNLTGDQEISVFCGNDEICREIDKQLSKTANISAYRWRLFGYDGIKDNAGTYILETCRFASGTIDQEIEELGIQAANVLIDKYHGINSVRRRKIVVEPKLITFSHPISQHDAATP